MHNIFKYLPLVIIILFVASCQSQVEKAEPTKVNKFEDENIVQIYKLIDQRKTDSLIKFLTHANEIYRYEAAIGFGSIQDSAAIAPLAFALNDTSSKVRRAAAYALGQTYDTTAIDPIIKSLESEDSVYVRQELLESLGKVITQEKIKLLQYWPLKTQEDKKGLAWGLYRAGLRNVHDGVSIDIALTLLDSSNSYETRLGAAHFLSKTANIDLTGRTGFIKKSAFNDASVNVRMASAAALGNAVEPASLIALKKLVTDSDYRVRLNAIKALGGFPFEDISKELFNALIDKNVNVSIAAAEIINRKVTPEFIEELNTSLTQNLTNRVKGQLYGGLLKVSQEKGSIINRIKSEYDSTDDVYYKSFLLAALGNSFLANEYVVTKTFAENSIPITTAGISALAQMRYDPSFPKELEASFAHIFQQAIESGDLALVYIACDVIMDSDLNFKDQYESFEFLEKSKNTLTLPKDIETYQQIEKTIAHFNDVEYVTPKNEYNHPINWELVQTIRNDAKAVITTEKGLITLKLKVEDAPGSVANFVALSRSGYYNDKNFHRVVPNFVIQGGCNRGDGWGGEDYTIRSEVPNLRYEEGSVGMASAGKDTEGTQWFITHSPTPHLDGKYTIFANVIDGMDVVHTIEVGDKIQSIEITN